MPVLRLFLDTNIYILGAADFTTAEGQILNWLEQVDSDGYEIELLVSGELLDQVARVAKRLTNKDNAGQLINRILAYLRICYVALNDDEIEFWLTQGTKTSKSI